MRQTGESAPFSHRCAFRCPFQPQPVIRLPIPRPNSRSVAIGDLNEDGKLDLFVGGGAYFMNSRAQGWLRRALTPTTCGRNTARNVLLETAAAGSVAT